MARIVSIPPATQAGGLSNSLVAGLVGDRVIDAFLVADNNNITGQFLRDLIGSAFDAHRTLQTMNAVAASATAMNAVAASSTAMNAVAASLTARSAVRQSTIAINAINAVQPALDIMYTAAVKWTSTANGFWQTGTLVGTGNYLVVRLTQRSRNWGAVGSTHGAYVRRGDLTGWTTTNAGESLNLIQRENGVVLDNALRTVNAQSIQFNLLEGVEIAYLTA